MQIEPHFLIPHLGNNPQRQSAGQGNLLAVHVGPQVACIGKYDLAVGSKPCRLAGGKALRPNQNAIQRLQDFCRALLAGSHQHGDAHRGLQPFAGHVSNHHQHASVGGRLHVEEISAHLVGRIVDRVHLKAGRSLLLPGNHQFLHAACRRQLAGHALLDAVNAKEPEKYDEHNRQNSREVRDRGKVNRNGAGHQRER